MKGSPKAKAYMASIRAKRGSKGGPYFIDLSQSAAKRSCAAAASAAEHMHARVYKSESHVNVPAPCSPTQQLKAAAAAGGDESLGKRRRRVHLSSSSSSDVGMTRARCIKLE